MTGGSPRPSVPAAQALSILTGLNSSPETVIVLVAFLHALFRNVMSPDVIELSLLSARVTAIKNGVSEKEFDHLADLLMKNWRSESKKNPLSMLY